MRFRDIARALLFAGLLTTFVLGRTTSGATSPCDYDPSTHSCIDNTCQDTGGFCDLSGPASCHCFF